jgi:AraC family transcriptional activator of tynA and feaB
MLRAGEREEATLARIDRLSTAGVPASQRHAYWQGLFDEPGLSMAIEGEPDTFHGALTTLTAGELALTSVRSSALVSRSAARDAGDERCFSLQLVHSGRCLLRHAGTEIIAEAGDMIVVDARRPYELAFKKPVHGLVLSLPWSRFGCHAAALEARAGRPMNRRAGPAAVLSGFVRSAWDQLVERDDEDWPESASEVIWDLLASALRDDSGGETWGSRPDELRRKATALIDARLFDPEFCSAAMPEELGVSARYLQRVLAAAGTTPSRLLLARRLDATAARLRSADASCRITDVALECGFSDLSYFSRAFRRRFGFSARSYRSSRGVVAADWL